MKSIALSEKVNIFFLTEDTKTFNELRECGEPVVLYPSIKAIRILLRARVAVVDRMEWIYNAKFHLLFFAKKVQLWHGVGFKKIELTNIQSNVFYQRNELTRCLTLIYRAFEGRYPKYDVLISTSPFYTQNVFSKAFKADEIINTGYPRDDIFFKKENFTSTTLISINCDMKCIETIKRNRLEGKKVIIYMPTFRDRNNNILESDAWDFRRFNRYCKKNNFILVIKEHPHPFFNKREVVHSNIIYYDSTRDVYPLLPNTDLLITDYSSIYMDYFLLNKPVIFYPYDYDDYVTNNREIQFDYDWITPGMKCFSQDELEHELYQILIQNNDTFMKKRGEIKEMAFKYHDGKSSERIWSAIKQRFLNV